MLPSLNQGVPRQTFSLLLLRRQRTVSNNKKKRKETRRRTVRRCQVALAKLSFVLEKARKSVLREMSIRPFSPETGKGTKISAKRDAKWHVSPRKLEKFRFDRYRAVDRYRGVDRYSESKLEPLTAVTVRYRGPRPYNGLWTAFGPWTTTGDGTALGYHINQEVGQRLPRSEGGISGSHRALHQRHDRVPLRGHSAALL